MRLIWGTHAICVTNVCVKIVTRKHHVITLNQKLKFFGTLKERKSQRLVSDIYRVPKSTVGDIWKELEKVEM